MLIGQGVPPTNISTVFLSFYLRGNTLANKLYLLDL